MVRLRCLGLEGDPQFAGLVAQIAEQTQELEALAEKQRAPDYRRPWWQDGEYDAGRADRWGGQRAAKQQHPGECVWKSAVARHAAEHCPTTPTVGAPWSCSANDRGMALFAAGQHSAAFDCFTEAIRLCPTSAVYHCNRAAAALKLGRPGIAAEDAAAAVQRDGGYLRAHLRAGRAHLQLRQPAAAETSFRRALELDGACAAAQRGLADAGALAREQQQQEAAERAEAQRGSRPGLTREAVPEEDAAAQLYAAEQMLAANPGLQAARCAHVEALLLCQRYADAKAACSSLLEGSADRLYLEAEAAWRQGSLGAAAERLQQALQAAGGSCGKCSSLLQFVGQLQGLEEEAALALEDGLPQRGIDACNTLLGRLHPSACTGLACATLNRRAEAHAARQAWAAAIADLDAALALEASHVACLQLRAEVHKNAGAYTQCFLDLQRLKKAAPGTPGLTALLEEAARLSLGGCGSSDGGDRAAARAGGGSAAAAALRVLGLSESATSAQARQAYLKLAATWHPDKWAGGSQEEQQAAEGKFKEVQAAYELLSA